MKRILSAALALTLLGSTAAVAAPYGHGSNGYSHSYNNSGSYRGYDRGYRHHNNDGAYVAAGLGIFALAAILASQNNDQRYDRRYDDRYNRGYDDGYGR